MKSLTDSWIPTFTSLIELKSDHFVFEDANFIPFSIWHKFGSFCALKMRILSHFPFGTIPDLFVFEDANFIPFSIWHKLGSFCALKMQILSHFPFGAIPDLFVFDDANFPPFSIWHNSRSFCALKMRILSHFRFGTNFRAKQGPGFRSMLKRRDGRAHMWAWDRKVLC